MPSPITTKGGGKNTKDGPASLTRSSKQQIKTKLKAMAHLWAVKIIESNGNISSLATLSSNMCSHYPNRANRQ